MGEDHFERDFECPCKNGTMTASWSEHDTWPSPNRSLAWTFECSDCEKAYRFYDDSIIRREDAEQLETLRVNADKAKQAVREAAAQHQARWVDYILRLPTKVAQNRALRDGSYGTFLKNASRPGYVQRQAEVHFWSSPKDCLDALGIKDDAVDKLHAEAKAADKAHWGFRSAMKKIGLPFR